MFSERSGPCVPQTGASVAGCSSEVMRPMLLEVHHTSKPESYTSSQSSLFLLLYVCVCTCMHVCSHVLVTGLRWEADCHPGAMPELLQSTLLPSFGLMNGKPPYQSLCLQSQVVPWSLTLPAAPVALLCTRPFFLPHTYTPASSTAQQAVDNYVQLILFRMYNSGNKKQCANFSSQKSCRAATLPVTQGTQAHTHVSQQIHHLYFFPNVLIFFQVAAACSQKYLFLRIFFFFFLSWGNTKEITTLSLFPALAKIINAFQRGTCGATYVEKKAEGCRHSSGAPVVDNKWGAVLGYVLQLSRLIIFDMHSGVYTVSSVKSSPATEGNRMQGAHTQRQARTHTHTLRSKVLRKQEPVVAFAFSLLLFLHAPSLIRGTIGGVSTCQLTDFLFPVAYEKIMAAGLQRLLSHQYEFTMVFMQH